MEFLRVVGDWMAANPGKTVGGLAGFVIGVLLFTVGWWKTLIIALLVLIGVIVGKAREDNVSIYEEIEMIFKRRDRDDY